MYPARLLWAVLGRPEPAAASEHFGVRRAAGQLAGDPATCPAL